MAIKSWLGMDFNRFRLGQLLFISGVTWGLFFGDGLRRALFLVALLCLTRSQIKEGFKDSWTSGQKKAGKFLQFFCIWAIGVPLIFGIEPFSDRFEGIFRPIELFIIMWETLVFAKDVFFFKNLKNFAITTCLIYAILALCQRSLLGFNVDFTNWIITGLAWRVGTLLAGLTPWALYAYMTGESRKGVLCCASCVLLAWATMFLTLYTTFWLVILVQITAAFMIIALMYRTYLKRICLLIVVTIVVGVCAIYGITEHYGDTRGLSSQWEQISSLGGSFDLTKFTNKRDRIWKTAIELTSQRPIFGYGWADGEFVGKDIGHMHNAILQAAWNIGWPGAVIYASLLLILLFASFKSLIREKGQLKPIPFVVMLALLAYIVCGILDDMFRSQRTIMTLYLSVFMLMLSPLSTMTHSELKGE